MEYVLEDWNQFHIFMKAKYLLHYLLSQIFHCNFNSHYNRLCLTYLSDGKCMGHHLDIDL
jgi:hypothetical protein